MDSISSLSIISVRSISATNPALYRVPGYAVLVSTTVASLLGEFQGQAGNLARWNVNSFSFTPAADLKGKQLFDVVNSVIYDVAGDGSLIVPPDVATVENISDDLDAVVDEVATLTTAVALKVEEAAVEAEVDGRIEAGTEAGIVAYWDTVEGKWRPIEPPAGGDGDYLLGCTKTAGTPGKPAWVPAP